MATCTLTLYKNTKLENSKNDIIENIETYLSSLESFVVDSSFQYQRFELDKTIKVDLDQEYQTKSDSFRKYNYCKISTEVDGEPVNYYYFITKASQIAQKTIELTLRMDTLNTFHFTRKQGEITNEEYKLSPKTTVKREHKDRLHIAGREEYYLAVDATTTQSNAITDWVNGDAVAMPGGANSLVIKFDFVAWVNYWASLEIVPPVTFPLVITPNDDEIYIKVIDNNDGTVDEEYSNSKVARFEINTDEMRVVFDNGYSTSWSYGYWWTSEGGLSLLFDIHFADPLQGQTGSSFAPAPTWGQIKSFFINNKVYNLHYINTYARNINEYSEQINTNLFKTNEKTLYDSSRENQWYLAYVSNDDIETTTTVSDAKVVNPVRIQLWSDSSYQFKGRQSLTTWKNIYATDARIPKWDNDEELVGLFTGYGGNSPFPTRANQIFIRFGNLEIDVFDYKDIYDRIGHFEIFAVRKYNSSTTFSKAIYSDGGIWNTITSTPFERVSFKGVNKFQVWSDNKFRMEWPQHEPITIYLTDTPDGTTTTSTAFEDVDLSDPRYIKVFAFPYCPSQEFSWYLSQKTPSRGAPLTAVSPVVTTEWEWNSSDNQAEIIKSQVVSFDVPKTIDVASPLSVISFNKQDVNFGKNKPRNIEYESKLYHSDYYLPKFVYDSFSFPFNLELIDVSAYDEYTLWELRTQFNFTYSVSKNIVSKFMFTFDECKYKHSTQDYDNILLINRNNEIALYNNSFINYIKSGGYNNDAQKLQEQNTLNGVTTGITLAASIATLVGGIAATASGYGAPIGVGAIVGGIAGIAGAGANLAKSIVNAQEQDRAMSQKMNELQMQGTAVQGNEDIDLLTKFSGNRPKLVTYEVSDIMKNSLWDLFHYCGYATYEQKVPHTDTRLYFNFIQADIVYDEYNFNDDIAEDIKNRWAQGVTFFHKVDGGYDIDQQYENFEVSLL